MFGLSKREKLTRLHAELNNAKSMAKEFYARKDIVEEVAFIALTELAKKKGITAKSAAQTSDGKKILAQVVLNRQYAFYLNECAIQIQAKIKRITLPDRYYSDVVLGDDERWLDIIVTPTGSYIVMSEIDTICSKLIEDVDKHIK
ncbi:MULTISPECIES: hypothetical protein [unclassified Serratia (in: enterobacteria)]|uniref:hypothetical protein n=1 Tax=unclassified Serratia (in: enterobacteria) TaxID=2647522 RepID=UPI003B43B5FD